MNKLKIGAIVLAALLVLETVGGLFGLGYHTKTVEKWSTAFDEKVVELATTKTQLIESEAKASSWQAAATSKKRIRITKRPVQLKDGVDYAWTWDVLQEAASSTAATSSISSSTTIASNSTSSTSSSSSGTSTGEKSKEKSGDLRYFFGPSIRIKGPAPLDFKNAGISAGGRVLWRLGGSVGIYGDGTATATILGFF